MDRGILLRGSIYVAVPMLSLTAERAAAYVEKPPTNEWEYVAWACAATTAALTSLRAFIDQHISKVNGKTP